MTDVRFAAPKDIAMSDESYEIEETEEIEWTQHGEDGLSEGHDV